MKDDYQHRVEFIRNKLLEWGAGNLRDYPWRNTRDPYKILVAEIMLHRTRADQVNEIYENFIQRFPDFNAIFESDAERIKKELYTLGLFWRAEMLYKLSEIIVCEYGGNIPSEKEKLMELPGIGDYIASALLCFCCNRPEPLLDTNTVRIIGRVFGLEINDSSRRNKQYRKILHDLIDCENPRIISLILIDFAAIVCKPGNKSLHSTCPLKNLCSMWSTNKKILQSAQS